jgi:hypothetical protein
VGTVLAIRRYLPIFEGKMVSHLGFRLLFSIWPLLLGMFSYTVQIFGQRFINLFWGAIYGLGMLLTDVTFGNSQGFPQMLLIGGLIWPICLTVLLFVLGGRVWRTESRIARWISVVLLALSSFLAVNLNAYNQHPYNEIPTYLSLMSAVY